MRASIVTGLVVAAAIATGASAADGGYKIINRIKLPDGGFDYSTFDPATGHVLVARMDFTNVIDTKTGAVSQLKSATKGHMALPIPGTTYVLMPQRGNMIRIADAAKDTVVADLPSGMGPDGAAWDPFTKMAVVANHAGGTVTLVDVTNKKIAGEIKVGGTLEFPVSDGMGHLFVNVEDQNKIAVIDLKTKTMTGSYALAGCDAPTGMAYIPQAKLLVSVCGDSGTAHFVQASDGKEVAKVKTGDGADAVMYDAPRHVVLVPCGESGELDVIDVADPAHIALQQKLPTQVGSRTGTVDAQGQVYMVAFKAGPRPAGGGRAAQLPGSYELIVVGK